MMPLKIAIFLIFVSFILGAKFGHWDAYMVRMLVSGGARRHESL